MHRRRRPVNEAFRGDKPGSAVSDRLIRDYRLLPGSPCIDAGDNLSVNFWTDMDGKRRFIDDPLTPDTGRGARLWPIVDMGAYELGNDPPKKVRQR